MFRTSILTDKFYVIKTGVNEYAVYVNDCAWQTTSSIDNATKISGNNINMEIKNILDSGFSYAEPVFVEELYNVFDVPKSEGHRLSSTNKYDVSMTSHPIYMFPRMGVSIIRLKTLYAKAPHDLHSDYRARLERQMMELVKTYSAHGVRFCPCCNKYESDGRFNTPNTFGHVMLYTRIGNSFEGYECEYCKFQSLNKIEHWG